jgi:hypothetical protein
MHRLLAALLGIALALPALAADATASIKITVVNATVRDGKMVVTHYVNEQVAKPVTVKEKVGDKVVTVTKTVVETVRTPVTTAFLLKEVKATGTDGKTIPAADLEQKLKDGGPVVMTSGPIGEDTRKVFKDGTVFIDESAIQPPK